MATPIKPSELKHPVVLLATGFGSGLAPKAPGTAGTMFAVPLVYLMQTLSIDYFIAIAVVTSIIGVWICDVAAKRLNVHDHPGIVFDEIAGYFITMIAAPAGWFWLLLGFVLFRVFDIIKPWPISWLDKKVKGGFGIMIDDIVAGLFALAVLQAVAWIGL